MKIEVLEGNLLDFPSGINVIAHSCNTLNIMGGGIAKSMSDIYPEVYEADSLAHENGEVSLGSFSLCKLKSDPKKRVVNLYTQSSIGSGKQVNYEAFYNALSLLASAMESSSRSGNYVLGLPYGISCGLAGGDWRIIESMIHSVFENCSFKVYLVKFK